MKIASALSAIIFTIISSFSACGQTYNQVQWGINRSATPSQVCIMNGTSCLGQIGSLNTSTGAFGAISSAAPTFTTLNGYLYGNGSSPVSVKSSINCVDAANLQTFTGGAGDGAKLQAVLNSTPNGQCVYLRSLGHPYYIDTGIALANGQVLVGDGGNIFAGLTATVAEATAAGTWLQCADTVNSCVKLQGNGSAIESLNFIWYQPTPTTGTYTPITYPWGIEAINVHFHISNVVMTSGTHCIKIKSGATYSYLSNINEACLNIGLGVYDVNDTMYLNNYHSRPLWYALNNSMINYLQNNKIAWDIHYFDNPMIDGFECFIAKTCMLFTNQTILGNTHSLYNAQMDKIQLNGAKYAMDSITNSATVWAQIGNLQSQQDTGWILNQFSNTYFRFYDNNQITISNFRVNDSGGEIMQIGTGTSGYVTLSNIDIDRYSAVTPGQVGFNISANAQLNVGTTSKFNKISGAGQKIAGAGILSPTKFDWSPFGNFGQWPTITGDGTYQDVTTDNYFVPSRDNLIKLQINGQAYVSTAGVGKNCTIRLSGATEVYASFSAQTTGWKNFDSNLVDSTSSGSIGRLQLNCDSGIVVNDGQVQVSGW